ncbi:MAG: BamA/TamA family outer membrane protein [Bacteroidota bacterium]
MKLKTLYILLIIFTSNIFSQNNGYELKSIEFVGNNSISSTELESVIISKESPGWFSQFINKFTPFGEPPIFFDSLNIPMDLAAIRSLYNSKGYFKAKVSSTYTISEDEAGLIYTIDESDPAYFESVEFNGLNNIPGEYLEDIADYVGTDTNTIYSNSILENKKNYTISFLRDHGYMLAGFDKPDVYVDTIRNKVKVQINFDTGKRYTIGNIYAFRTGEGMNYVDDQLLKDIVGIEPGDTYSYYDIQRGQVRLYRTELFNSAVINSVISDTSGNTVPLNISADVGKLHELSPEIIANNEDNTFNLGLGLNFIKKNFLGEARKLTVGISAAAQNISEFVKNPSFNDSTVFGYADARITIEQPYLFNKPINTSLETYYTLQKRKNEYDSKLYGARLNFDFELPQFTYFNSFNSYFNIERAEYTYKEEYLTGLLSYAIRNSSEVPMTEEEADSAANLLINDLFGGQLLSQSTNALIGFSLGSNNTNDILFPSAGYNLSLLIEDANSLPYLFSKIFSADFSRPLFLKLVASSSFYLPVYSSNVNSLGVKLKVGQIFTYHGDKAQVSLNQRLYAGGSNSVRGWGTRELVPQEEIFDIQDISQEDLEAILLKGAASGGFFLFEGSIETRNRLFGKFGTALFLDYGNTWNDFNEFRLDQIAVAGGFGLRYYSDFAPFRIDFGLKLIDPKDRRNISEKVFWKDVLQFHIGIGEAF